MKENKKKRSWKRVVSILSGVVVFCTTYALILPAVTMSKETYCGKEAHVHTEACYRSQTPLCGKEEGEPNEGHVHDETCYELVKTENLLCELEENDEHLHSDECYEWIRSDHLICQQEEAEASEGHTHTDECYQSEELQCGKEEHEHTRICESNKEDVEDPADWDEAYKELANEEDAKTRILTVAKNELGTKENKNNFEIDEEEKEHYYTRYGHLYEDQYGDWNNYFTGYVLKYANVQMSYDKDASKWQNKTIHDQKEEGEEGNVVFFRNDEGELRTGIVTSIDDLKKEIRVIEGDVEGEVKEERVNKDKVIAYLNDQIEIIEDDTPLAGEELEKKEENKITQTAKDEAETVEVTATYTEEANIPEGAQLTVTKLEDAENGNPRFDIGFYVGQEEVEPNAEVEISIKYLDEKLDGSEIVDYIHYKKDGSTETISSDVKALEDGSVETIFKTDSFSVFEAEIIVGVKKVEIEGADGEVEIGTEVTLTAEAKGYKEDEKLYYQWQYNPVAFDSQDNDKEYQEKEEDWYDIENQDQKDYKFTLDMTNSDYLYRVKVDNKKIKFDDRTFKKDENETSSGGLKVHKVTLKAKLNLFKNEEEPNEETSENEESQETISEGIAISSFIVNKAPVASYISTDYDKTGLWDIPHTKTIKQMDAENDLYRLFLDFGPTAGSKPMDLIVIIDTSGSMNSSSRLDNVKNTLSGSKEASNTETKSRFESFSACEAARNNEKGTTTPCESYWNNYFQQRWQYTVTTKTEASDGLISKFLSLNAENRISFGTFSSKQYMSTNERKSQWYQSNKSYDSLIDYGIENAEKYVNDLTANGGTNYMSGLRVAHSLLGTSDPTHAKHVIFLTDGAVTQAYSKKNNQGKDDGLGDNDTSWFTASLDNLYTEDDGSGTSQPEVQYTVTGIKQFHLLHPDVGVSTVGYDMKEEYLLPLLQNQTGVSITKDGRNGWTVDNTQGIAFGDGKYFAVSSNGNGTDSVIDNLNDSFELISRGPRCTNLELTDTLSKYVDFNGNDVDIQVKAIPQAGQTDSTKKMIFHYSGGLLEDTTYTSNQNDVVSQIPNGDKTGKNKEKEYHQVATEIIPTVQINGQKITLTFDSNWELDPTYSYELSFNVKVTQDAYDEYDKSGYLHTGSEDSDHYDNNTSEGQQGFYTNILDKTTGVDGNGVDTSSAVDAATLSYNFDGKEYSTQSTVENQNLHKFQRPVVQVHLKDVEMVKTDDKDLPLAKAEFDLYVVDEGTLQIPGSMATGSKYNTGKAYVSAQNGEISFGELKSGTYYLVETKAPDGFNLLANTYKLEVTTQGVRYYQVKVENGNEVKVGESRNADPKDGKYILKIANEPGQSLPNTGGAGTKLFTFSGGAIIAASSLMYGYKKRSKRNKTGKGGK